MSSLPQREHFAQPRGFLTLKCPMGRCEYRHRFSETDLTVGDKLTEERRLEWLRTHHEAGHPTRDVKRQRLRTVIDTAFDRAERELYGPASGGIHSVERNTVAKHLIELLEPMTRD
jgi:hypothetical protein